MHTAVVVFDSYVGDDVVDMVEEVSVVLNVDDDGSAVDVRTSVLRSTTSVPNDVFDGIEVVSEGFNVVTLAVVVSY